MGLGLLRFGAVERVTVGAVAVGSTAVARNTNVLLQASTDLYWAAGVTPTVTATTGHFLAAGERALVALENGEEISFIQNTAGGFVTLSEVTPSAWT